MTCRLTAIGFDAVDPMRLAEFWALALGWRLEPTRSEVALEPTDGVAFRIVFRTARTEKPGQNRLHLDLTSTSPEDQLDSVARLLDAGARHIDIGQRAEEPHVVLADPEGNEFCVIEAGNSFLAGCARIGAINADGTRETGVFWSEALGWPLVWDQDDETAIRSPGDVGPLITWSGPPLMPKSGPNRLTLELTTDGAADVTVEIERLVRLGARRLDTTPADGARVAMVDPDDNEFFLIDGAAPARPG